MGISKKVSDTDFKRLVPDTKVRSLLSYAEGIILSQDFDREELEIKWTRGEETITVKRAHQQLNSVVLI